MKTPLFITIEGIEGVGKSTVSTYLRDYLMSAQEDVLLTREPGGTQIAEDIRKILLTPSPEMLSADAEILLMFAARSQHIQQVILPALKAGKWVISDRFVDASFAYQGGGRGLDLTRIQFLENWIVHSLKPHITFLLDAPVECALQRAKQRGAQDRIEQEKLDFFERVRAAYLARAKTDSKRFRIIDATQPLEVVKKALRNIMEVDAHVFS